MPNVKEADLSEIKATLKNVIGKLRIYCNGEAPTYAKGMYSVLSKKYPLYVDENVPLAAMQNMRNHHTPACADEGHVYFSSEMFKELWEEGLNRTEPPIAAEHGLDMGNSIETLLIHEYTHVVMEHCKRTKTFARKSKNAKNIHTYTLACEIEANRGWGMPENSYTYKIGVTEQSFPECQNVYGLTNIYNVLKKHYKDDIDNYVNQASAGGEKEGKGEGGSSQSAESSLSNEQKKALDKFAKEQHTEQLMEQQSGSGDFAGTSISGGMGEGEPIEKEYNSASEAFDAFKDREVQKEITADLSVLKGVLTGENIAVSKVKTYSRQARRDGEGGLMKKGVKKGARKSPRILIALDCSGSMNSTSMSDVMSTCASIIRATGTKTSGSYICTHDEIVSNMMPLHEWESVIRKFHPYGGNNFNDLLKRALELDVDIVIDLGDGFDTITNSTLLRRAKDKGLKWVDVVVNEEVSKERLTTYLDSNEEGLGDLRLQRQILKVK